jgi:hypothetical protein
MGPGIKSRDNAEVLLGGITSRSDDIACGAAQSILVGSEWIATSAFGLLAMTD